MTFLLSTGGEDKCVFQWKLNSPDLAISEKKKERHGRAESDQSPSHASEEASEEDEFGIPGGGDEFMAVKPW